MIGNQTLTELLLIESPKLVQMTASLNGILMKFIPAIFTFAIVIEYFNGMNWGTLVKRLFISTFILAFYTSAHIEFIKGAITIAEKGILSKTNGNVDASYFKMNKKDLRNIEEVKNRETKRAKKNESFGKSLLTKFTIVPKGALYISILYKYWFKSLTDRALPDFTTLFVWISFRKTFIQCCLSYDLCLCRDRGVIVFIRVRSKKFNWYVGKYNLVHDYANGCLRFNIFFKRVYWGYCHKWGRDWKYCISDCIKCIFLIYPLYRFEINPRRRSCFRYSAIWKYDFRWRLISWRICATRRFSF